MARYPAFQHRNFTLLWAGLIVSNVGTWMQNVAQSWLIFKMTGSDPIYLGWLGLSFALPMVLVPPIGGVVVDRVDRMRLLFFTQSASLALATLLAVLTWTGAVRPAHILVTTAAGALLLAFDNPARQSLVAELVPKSALQNALSLNSATFTGAALVGPALSGALLPEVGAGWLFMLNAVSFLAVLFALFAMKDVPKHTHPIPPLSEALFGGLRYVWKDRQVLGILVLSALGALLARSYQQLLPVFAEAYESGSGGYGALLAGGGAGALIGALGMSSLEDIRQKGRVMLAAGFVLCAMLLAFSVSKRVAVGVAMVVGVGVASTVFTTMIATMIQLRVPGPLRGRVVSLYVSTLIGLPSLGALGVAALAKSMREGDVEPWARPLEAIVDATGIGASTAAWGDASGAPRAVAVGALVFVAVLLLAAPRFLRDRESPRE